VEFALLLQYDALYLVKYLLGFLFKMHISFLTA